MSRWDAGTRLGSGALLCLLLIFGAGCAQIVIGSPAPAADAHPTGSWRAGAAKVDLTPMPGFPMGGYSLTGQTARGYWTRIHAHAIYLEDPRGRRLAMVSCDLWSMPAGLADRVAELVAADPRGRHGPHGETVLARDQILIAATHTHTSPGNFSSTSAYNALGSPRPGFDEGLFEFLAQRIAEAVVGAVRAARPATVAYAEGPVAGLARNRSFAPFLRNAPEAEPLLRDNASLPEAAVPGEYLPPPAPHEAGAIYRAVRPRLGVMTMHVPGRPAEVIAVAAFVAAHQTSIGHHIPLYTSDLFGVAAILVEHALRGTAAGRSPVVAIFNGAEGDVSPAWQCRDPARAESCQWRADALALGRVLAHRIAELSRRGRPLSGAIEHRFDPRAELAGRCVSGGASICTAKNPMVGAAMVGGAPDGRSEAHELGWREGATGPGTPNQGPKRPAFDPSFVPANSPVGISRFVMGALSAPHVVPLGLYRIGPILLVAVPGEFTTVMGLRIERALSQALAARGRPVEHVIVVGLANEYVSYFTTPEEYPLQFYEGASTVYGPASGPVIQDQLTALAGQLGEPAAGGGKPIEYAPGPKATFGLGDVKAAATATAGLDGMLSDAAGHPLPSTPRFCWPDRLPTFPSPGTAGRVTPAVAIEVRQGRGAWRPLTTSDAGEENDEGFNFITTASATSPAESQWCAIWLGAPPAGRGVEARFRVTTLDGDQLHAPVTSPTP